MARHKLAPSLPESVKDRLVDEELDQRLDALALRQNVSALPWWLASASRSAGGLYTAYGTLEIHRDLGGWTVKRDEAALVHARSAPHEAIFSKQRTAMATALVHLTDGFGDTVAIKDGLWWDIQQPAAEYTTLQPSIELDVDTSITDDHEWGRRRLKQLLETSKLSASPEDENLIAAIRSRSRWAAFTPPPWNKLAHGYFQLHTPYCTLIVRRLIGWTVERDGMPLVWFHSGERLIFDKLEHAKTIALIHARDTEQIQPVDGTRWSEAGRQPTKLQPN
jgi:hypothetical protein